MLALRTEYFREEFGERVREFAGNIVREDMYIQIGRKELRGWEILVEEKLCRIINCGMYCKNRLRRMFNAK